MNTNEAILFNRYLAHTGMLEAVFGNISKKNSVFGVKEDNIDSEQYWPQISWLMPISNNEIKIWTPEEKMLTPSHDFFDDYYRELCLLKNR
jgi:hypothetical protein